MEEIIKTIEELRVAQRCAGDFDYCPEYGQAEYIIENLFSYDIERLRLILAKYSGKSYDSLGELIAEQTDLLIEKVRESLSNFNEDELGIIEKRICPKCGFIHKNNYTDEDHL